MKAYVSCDNPWHWHNDWQKAGVELPRLLFSFAYNQNVKEMRALCPDLLVDSGAYSVMTGKVDLKLENYAAFVQKNQKLANFINFDEPPDNEKSLINWKKLNDLGCETMPVFQSLGSFKYLENYCKQVDYVAVACHWPWKLQQAYFKKCFKIAGKTKLHLLGVASPNVLNTFRPYSFDTSFLSKPVACGWFYYMKEGIQKAHWTRCLHDLKRDDIDLLRTASPLYRRKVSWDALECLSNEKIGQKFQGGDAK